MMINDIDMLITTALEGNLQEFRFNNIELKRDWRKDYGKKICAIANKVNKNILWLVVGIEDDGSLSLQDEKWAKKTEEVVSQHINQYLDPVQTCLDVCCRNVDGSWIIIITLQNPGIVVRWDNVGYTASGSTIKELNAQEILEMTLSLPGLTDYSAQKWTGEVNQELVKQFAKMLTAKRSEFDVNESDFASPEVFLERVKIKDTNTSRILFGDITYRVVYYDSNEEPIRNEKYSGLFGILTNLIIEIQKHSYQCVNDYYSDKVLKEALANAVAHAAYYEKDGELIIEVFHDRISISNLCFPENGAFANKWFSRSHKTNNNLLMETLRLCGIVDELGRGKNLIFTESLRKGKKSPQVIIEEAVRFNRWRLLLFGGVKDEIQLKLFERLKQYYKNENKALIANALILWREQPVNQLKQYIDGESIKIFAEILADVGGPIFYYKQDDSITLTRWVKILLGEGKNSKILSEAEELNLINFAYDICSKYYDYYITPKKLRNLANMGETTSERTLSSKLLSKWDTQGHLKRTRKGLYKFAPRRRMTNKLFNDIIVQLEFDIK